MNKKKLIPIIIAIVLLIVAVFLFFHNKNKKVIAYTKLVINYKNEIKEYTELSKTSYITIADTKFVLGAIEPEKVILVSTKDVTVNKKETKEVEILGGKEYKVCIDTDNCFLATYSR